MSFLTGGPCGQSTDAVPPASTGVTAASAMHPVDYGCPPPIPCALSCGGVAAIVPSGTAMSQLTASAPFRFTSVPRCSEIRIPLREATSSDTEAQAARSRP